MKKLFTAIVAIVAIAMFTSCEQDAPEINFTQTDTHISDYSGIIAAINSQTISLEAKLQLINEAIDAHACNNNYNGGIYRLPGDPNALYMQPSVWEAIKGDPDLEAAILSTLSEPVVNITQILPAGHNPNHPISYVRTSGNTAQLSSTWDNTSIQVDGVNQELVKVYKKLNPTTVTYELTKFPGCGAFFEKVFITDARGTDLQQYDFGRVNGPVTVQVEFEDSGNLVTSIEVTANMID